MNFSSLLVIIIIGFIVLKMLLMVQIIPTLQDPLLNLIQVLLHIQQIGITEQATLKILGLVLEITRMGTYYMAKTKEIQVGHLSNRIMVVVVYGLEILPILFLLYHLQCLAITLHYLVLI